MNIWRFGALESRHDVIRRFFLRLFWTFLGSWVAFFLFERREPLWLFFGGPTAIAVLGALADAFRLKHPGIGVQRLRWILVVFILAGLLAGVVVTFWLRR